ncbi:MAG: M61 family metallopeptidase [Pyrinomonadaceae bacterium]
MMNKGVKIRSVILILSFFLVYGNLTMLDAQSKKKKTTLTKTVATAMTNTQVAQPEISYTVSMSKPWTHLLEVEMRVKPAQKMDTAEISMPVWTPGSYLIREYARHVEGFAAKDAAGNPLQWRKTDKNTWQIDTKGAPEYVASYRVYANELTVRTNELNDRHAFFNNAATLMFPEGALKAPSTLRVVPYKNWKIATGLPRVGDNTFRAENFDILYDSPFEVGDFKEISFDVQSIPHRMVFEGDGNYDMQKTSRDVKKIIEEAYKIFGELPYKDYLFIVNLRGGGGLEHLNSTALQFNRFGFTTNYDNFLSLAAHEYFHAFNVKRIRPDALGPFDYNNENYTKLLWVAEGGTAYYESVLLSRAGLLSDKDFLAGKAQAFQALQNRPGRFETSLEDASFNAWIKYYRPDENGINNQISYYDKGEIINFLLDLEIRKSSGGAKSLDDVMRYLYTELYKNGKNYTPEDYQRVSEMMAGRSLDDFFSKYVRGTAEIDYNSILNGFGLQLATGENGKQSAYLGANTRPDGEKLMITSVPAGTPAYDQGLNANDQIVAVDGIRATQSFLQSYLNEKHPGDKVKITVFRFDELRDFDITLGGRAAPNYKIAAVENPSETQRKLYLDFFGTELK